MNVDDLETGDILLFNENPNNCCMGMLDCLIKICTNSSYSHSAIVLRDPPWIEDKGVYVWESTYHGNPDPQDNKVKFGVQLTSIERYTEDYPGCVSIYVRKCSAPELWTTKILNEIRSTVYCKPYDILPQNWFQALIQIDMFQPRTTRFFCSALVAYILMKVGIVDRHINWTKVSAQKLSSSVLKSDIIWIKSYGDDIFLSK